MSTDASEVRKYARLLGRLVTNAHVEAEAATDLEERQNWLDHARELEAFEGWMRKRLEEARVKPS